MSESENDKVSNNAKKLLLTIVISAGAITALVSGGALLVGAPEIAEKAAIAFVSGIIGFGAGIVTALFGK